MLSVASVSRNLSVCAVEITTNLLQGFIYLSYFVHSHLYIYEVERGGGMGHYRAIVRLPSETCG